LVRRVVMAAKEGDSMHRSMADQIDPSMSIHIEAKRGVEVCQGEDVQGDQSSPLCLRWLHDRVMNAGEPEDSEPAASEPEKRKAPAALNPIIVLRELFELLEDYAPAWYSEENHRRAEAILKAGAR